MSKTEALKILQRLVHIKDLADNNTPTLAHQGQAMSGYCELAEYRALIEKARELLPEEKE